ERRGRREGPVRGAGERLGRQLRAAKPRHEGTSARDPSRERVSRALHAQGHDVCPRARALGRTRVAGCRDRAPRARTNRGAGPWRCLPYRHLRSRKKTLMNIPSYQPAVALEFFKAAGKVESIAPGATIFHQNTRSRRILLERDSMYLLLRGEVSLRSGPQEIGAVRAGEIFGEMAAIGNVPRSATAVAKTACRVIALDDRQFKRALRKKP